jgi:hypothetical protein
MRGYLWFAILFVTFATKPAFAAGTREQRAHCADDAFRLCDAYIPDESAVGQCLRGHMSELSPACRREFAGAPAKARKHARRRSAQQRSGLVALGATSSTSASRSSAWIAEPQAVASRFYVVRRSSVVRPKRENPHETT